LNYELWVAETDGRVAGFLVLSRPAPGECEILNLAVGPQCRRAGVATALLRVALHDFRGDVFLEVRESNAAARKFYKRLGFQELTVREKYYNTPLESAIVMKFHSC
jgi:ribosomal-protein-alanine N-acetyltransferase